MTTQEYGASYETDLFFKDGWNEISTGIETKPIQVNERINSELSRTTYSTASIKQKLRVKLFQGLRDSNYIEYRKQEIPMKDECGNVTSFTDFSAKINIADKIFDSHLVDRRMFFYRGTEFSEEKLKQAIDNTFPEELI